MHPRARLRHLGARSAVVGGIATVVGVLGHERAGGDAPTWWQFGLLWLLCSGLSAAFLIRPAGWLRLAIVLVVEQVLVHAALMTVAMSGAAGTRGMAGMAGMGGMPGMSAMPATPMAPMPAMSPVPSLSMLMMHALAALVVGAWLWRGECALLRLIALAWVSIRFLWRPAVTVRVSGLARAAVDVGLRPLWSLRSAQEVLRRGPPAARAF